MRHRLRVLTPLAILLGLLAALFAGSSASAAPARASNAWAVAPASNAWAVSHSAEQAGSKWWAPPAAVPLASNAWATQLSSNAWAAPEAVTHSGVVPFTLSWTAWQHCYFSALQWVDVRAQKDVIGTTVKNYRMQINGPSEPVNAANIWERRGSVDIYTGGYAGGANGNNWTSPVTQLPYMASGANRYAMIQVKKTGLNPVCSTAVKIG